MSIETKDATLSIAPKHLIDLSRRPRRNRRCHAIRSLICETRLHPENLVAPLFVINGKGVEEPISSMPGIYRYSIDRLLSEIESLSLLGIKAIDLFPVIPKGLKDGEGSEAYRPNNLLFQAIKSIKQEFPDLWVMVDIALDPYTDHGHDGLVDEKGNILNDATLTALGKLALLAAEAGADMVAPSDMMDGRVAYLRHCLDQNGMEHVGILSYAAKYASAFYGPFREALHSAPQFGDKKTYQMDPANWREALLESHLDEIEGADMVMIKPGLPYLDVIAKVRQQTHLPIGAYHVSGEYAMVIAAAEKGWLDADRIFMESLLSIKRAGADFIFTYAAKRVAALL